MLALPACDFRKCAPTSTGRNRDSQAFAEIRYLRNINRNFSDDRPRGSNPAPRSRVGLRRQSKSYRGFRLSGSLAFRSVMTGGERTLSVASHSAVYILSMHVRVSHHAHQLLVIRGISETPCHTLELIVAVIDDVPDGRPIPCI